jgi:hypothetical protein
MWHVWNRTNGYRVFLEISKKRYLFADLGVDEKIQLKQTLKEWNGRP